MVRMLMGFCSFCVKLILATLFLLMRLRQISDLRLGLQRRVYFEIYKVTVVSQCALRRVASLLVLLQVRHAIAVRIIIGPLSEVAEILQLPPIRQTITIR